MMSRYGWRMVVLVLCLGAYHLPWTTHNVAAFTNNAFDLAEFMSLHPSVRAESPALYTSLLLRLPVLLIAGMIMLTAAQLNSEKAQWIWRALTFLVILRLNPPTIYYPFGGGSPNDQQLGNMMFGGLVFVGLLLVLTLVWRNRYALAGLNIVLAVMTIVVSVVGYDRSMNVIDALQLDVGIGGGYVLLIALIVLVIVDVVWETNGIFRNKMPITTSKGQGTLVPAHADAT